ncbi:MULTISPECIES: protein-export chaperone SecB [Francisella]|uniref:Protein-export protein SecB n=1 Tax=Francisella opportunistica TaxID=2016517 RepID=A0A345JPB7_9GAMM|nr:MULTISPECIES: protein-export chaperone SecB [Francisella]APC90827.1 Protein export cytoplasm chaperone protein (SecB) [Francisella sp. MA067296]AXH29163.1 protein-export chaperone SecB [Francisella opportunistica]AXH30814.1 protein-export chaperone SecB [Francisella opportunistica]AXH32459.1 protein-export chaperone SecB [Francisella opportunistica]
MDQQAQPQFQIQKVYVKDLSFSIPNSDKIWTTNWKPELHTDLKVEANKLPEENTYETVLTLEIKVENDGMIAFEAEVKQAGIFTVANMQEAQIEHAKQAFCPNILYHYAREALSDLVISGGFPQLCLSAVNFDAMYQDSLKESADNKQH